VFLTETHQACACGHDHERVAGAVRAGALAVRFADQVLQA